MSGSRRAADGVHPGMKFTACIKVLTPVLDLDECGLADSYLQSLVRTVKGRGGNLLINLVVWGFITLIGPSQFQ